MVHQRLAHADEAVLRMAGGARWARTRTGSRTSWYAPAFHRPPASRPSATSCGGLPFKSGYASFSRRSPTRKAAPSCAAAQGCGRPVRVSGETSVASQHTSRAKSIAWGRSALHKVWQSTKRRPVGQTATGERRKRKGTRKAAACVRESKRFEYAMHSTAIHVASRPGPGRSRDVDGLPLRLLPTKGTHANPPPGGARVPQPHFSGPAQTHRR